MALRCALLGLALCVLSQLPACAAKTFSRYNTTFNNAPGQLLTVYTNPPSTLSSPAQNPLGPFLNSTYLQGPNDAPSLASTWQMPVNLPWNFSFYGVNYSAITVTSKGFLYFGSYPYQTDLQNLESVADAPDYSPQGTGFPTVNGVARPVLSYFHSAGGGVPIYDLVNYGSLSCLQDGTVSQSGGGQCVLADYYWQLLPAMTPTMMLTGSGPRKVLSPVLITPVNSVASPADGQRFVLTALDLRDSSGAQSQSVVVLYQSGLIEVYWYQVSQNVVVPTPGQTCGTADYPVACNFATTPQAVSAGISGVVPNTGTVAHFSSPANIVPSMNFSQQLFATLAPTMKMSSLSFQPIYT